MGWGCIAAECAQAGGGGPHCSLLTHRPVKAGGSRGGQVRVGGAGEGRACVRAGGIMGKVDEGRTCVRARGGEECEGKGCAGKG